MNRDKDLSNYCIVFRYGRFTSFLCRIIHLIDIYKYNTTFGQIFQLVVTSSNLILRNVVD
jgi:hypothetical protein